MPLIFPLPTTVIGNYGWPIKQTPVFNTITQLSTSGRGELRIPTMYYPRWNFSLDVTFLPGDGTGVNTDWQVLNNFLMGVQGAGENWLFLHPYHNTANYQVIATGNGTVGPFPMIWTLVPNGAQELVQNFVSTPSIYVNGVLQSSSNYTIDQWGNLVFGAGHAPGVSTQIAWSGQFYYTCRFKEDFWQELQEEWHQLWTISQFRFQSVLL